MTQQLKETIAEAANKAGYPDPIDFEIEIPPQPEMGDYSTNIALVIGTAKKERPDQVAEKIINKLSGNNLIAEAKSAGPGFINIIIQDHTLYDEIKKIQSEKDNYGRLNLGQNKRASIDYVSANPTGPIHIGNARGGPIGETLSNLLEFVGFKVIREFYINDLGLQVDRLGETLYYWVEKINGNDLPFPEEGYRGEYIKKVAQEILKKSKNKIGQLKDKEEVIQYLKEEGLDYLVDTIKKEIDLLGIKFDKWVYESEVQASGETEKVVDQLKKADASVGREGALWFKNPLNLDFKDKESVLQKSDAEKSYTYFADDLAYHMRRYNQGIELILNIWGSNHHGHVPRMRSALEALGISKDRFKVLLYQYVRIKNGEEILKMSKRMGNFVTLGQVLDGGVAPDAFKYFILAQNINTPIDFDVKLACDKSEKNPVYYIQYAHARICSILRQAGETDQESDLLLLKNNKEKQLMKAIALWPDIVAETASNFQIQSLPHYAYKLATLFHDFYTNCQVLCDDKKLSAARLSLITATKIVLKNVLSICGISAPEKM